MDSRVGFHLWEDLHITPSLESVPRVDAVIHLAGEPIAQRWNSETKKAIRDSRVVGLQRLVEALGRAAPQARSAGKCIGNWFLRGPGRRAIDRKQRAGKGLPCRTLLGMGMEGAAPNSVCVSFKVRIGVVLGQDGGALKQMLPVFRSGLGGQFGDGRQWVSWIERDDLLRMFRWAADTGDVEGVLNGTAPNPVTNAELTKALARVVHRPAFFRVPKFALRIALGEMADFSARASAQCRKPPKSTDSNSRLGIYPEPSAAPFSQPLQLEPGGE